jgi:hypothetical protein
MNQLTELGTKIQQSPAAAIAQAMPLLSRIVEDANAALPPTPDEIDSAILFYKNAKACFAAAKKTMEAEQETLVKLVDKYGHRPAGAEQSIRMAGRRNTVTITRGTTVTVDEQAVEVLDNYLGPLLIGASRIFDRLFAKQTTHKLLKGASEFLKEVDFPQRTEEKILSLFGRCIDVKTNAPSVKVKVIKAEKPARKARGGKVAA